MEESSIQDRCMMLHKNECSDTSQIDGSSRLYHITLTADSCNSAFFYNKDKFAACLD